MKMETLWAKLHDDVPDASICWVSPLRDMSVRVPYEDALRVRSMLARVMTLTAESCGALTATSEKGLVLLVVDSIPLHIGAVAIAEHVIAGGECTPQALSEAWDKRAVTLKVGEPLEPTTDESRLLAEMLIERVDADGGPPTVTMNWIERAASALSVQPSISDAARILAGNRPVRAPRPRDTGSTPNVHR